MATATLPTDPEELCAFALALQHELYSKTLHIEKLRAQLVALRRSRFGQSSEKLDRQIEQIELAIGDLEEGEAEKRRASRSDGSGGAKRQVATAAARRQS
ncbi:transposase domain-containing protein [Caulobacter sp. DWP3-1-3b2]|uniref:transposase domain-containing protein n=1 Tax=Caulobacter sp. DWP3-1-3b2 TaxID=2804643 RepID=UPI003CE6E698